MKKSSVFGWHRRLKEGQENVQDDPRRGQPKTQRTDVHVDRVWTFVRSDQRLGVRLIAKEINMNREAVRQIITKDLGKKKISTKMVPQILTMTINNVGFTFHLIFYTMQRCLKGSLPLTKCGVSIRPGNKTWEPAVGNTEFTSAEKSTHVSLTVQEHVCVFLRSQADSSLRIHCTRTNGELTVIFGSADKVTGICSEEMIQTLASQVDSPLWQCPCAWCVKSSWIPG
jgi:hypothetical protein